MNYTVGFKLITFCSLFFLILTSCHSTTEKKEVKPIPALQSKFCKNELELLVKQNAPSVHYNFNLTNAEQIAHFQKELDTSLCNKPFLLNSHFELPDYAFKTSMIVDWYCEDFDLIATPCFMIRPISILVNTNEQVLLSGYLTNHSWRIKGLFLGYHFKRAAYKVSWDEGVKPHVKMKIIDAVIKGYLQAANTISIEEYGKELCNLDSALLHSLKVKFRFAFLIEKEIRPRIIPEPAIISLDELESDL